MFNVEGLTFCLNNPHRYCGVLQMTFIEVKDYILALIDFNLGHDCLHLKPNCNPLAVFVYIFYSIIYTLYFRGIKPLG